MRGGVGWFARVLYGVAMSARGWLVAIERAWDGTRLRRAGDRPPEDFRIESYDGYGGPSGLVLRGRVLDDPEPPDPVEGERRREATLRTVRRFVTDELPDVPLQISVAGQTLDTVTDAEGYYVVRLPDAGDGLTSPWTFATVRLAASYRGLRPPPPTSVRIRVPGSGARFGVISDVDDTVLETGVQRTRTMVRRTFTGSVLTRTTFPGAPELYRDLAGDENPVFYVSSSPWNLHAFVAGFLEHQGFPAGPVLLRDLLGGAKGREAKHGRIREVLDLYPSLPFVLIGDSGERDPEVYADIVRAYPGRILAVYIREVRLIPTDGRVEKVLDDWPAEVPFVLAKDSTEMRAHAADAGLLPEA